MKKTTGALVGLCATGPLLLALPILGIGAGTASASCSTDGAQGVDASAVAKQVKAILDGGDKGSVSVPGLDAPADQVPNAKTIQATGVAMNIPARGQVVALATALQESGLRNLTYGDRDSLGLFQQRPSMGWGTASQILDPVHASTKFYEGLKKVSGWQSLSVTQAAQAVQKSGFPEAYAKWESLATALQKAIEPLLQKAGGASPSPSPSGSADTGSPSPDSAGVVRRTVTGRTSAPSQRVHCRRSTRFPPPRRRRYRRRSGGRSASSAPRISGAERAPTPTAKTRWAAATAPP
ncbi:hypothetical protein OIM90_27600 [Streptomyces sp. AD16]|nr:hypothetical protein OIM90_27600 [Streptomyces sp. AD16]